MRRKQKYSWFGFDANRGSGSSSWDGRSSCSQSSSSTASKFPDFQPCQCRAADTIHTSRYNTAFVEDFSVSRYSLRYFALILHPLLSLLLRSNLPGQRTHRAKDQGLVARTIFVPPHRGNFSVDFMSLLRGPAESWSYCTFRCIDPYYRLGSCIEGRRHTLPQRR